MSDHIEAFLNDQRRKKSEGTYRARKTNLTQFTNWLDDTTDHSDPTELDKGDIEEYVFTMDEQDYSESTIRHRILSVKLYYRYLIEKVDDVSLGTNPAEEVDLSTFTDLGSDSKKRELQEEVPYVYQDEKEKMCENVPNPPLRNELILRLLWHSGVRAHELVNIRLDNIDREERAIEIYSEKTDDWRTVYYQPPLDFIMQQWIDGGYRDSYLPAKESPYLFVTLKSEKMTIKAVNQIVRRAAEKAGVQEVLYTDAAGNDRYRITTHAFRHGYAVQCLKNGMDIARLASLLGHFDENGKPNIDTTEKYLRIVEDDLADAAQKYGAGSEERV